MTTERPESRGLSDVDSHQTALRLHIAAWSFIGGVIGALFGWMLSRLTQTPAVVAVPIGLVIGALVIYVAVTGLSELAGQGVFAMLAPSGRTTRSPNEYSLAESYVARGRLEQAIAEYELGAENALDDPEPRLRLARLYRDRMDQPEEALRWFRRARDVALDPTTEWVVVRELAELARSRLGDPKRALPDLARLSASHPDTGAGEWARGQIAAIKDAQRAEE